ncbi:AfsR/SARP family transcriptional regulator [Amycolatopsis sp. NPDC003731]
MHSPEQSAAPWPPPQVAARVPRFAIPGPVRAWYGGAELDLGTPQQRAVLANLLLRDGKPATTDDLVAALWGAGAPAAGAAVIRTYLSRLRKALPIPVLESTRGLHAIPTHNSDLIDLAHQRARARAARRNGDRQSEAAALRTAVGLWRGTPLTGANGEFVEGERARLHQLRLAVVEDLAAADLASGQHAEVPDTLAELIDEQPLRERPYELLMLALYRSGRQADALEVFAGIRSLLDRELGLLPGPGLRAMHQRILAADPALLPAGTQPTTGPRPSENRDRACRCGPSAGPDAARAL